MLHKLELAFQVCDFFRLSVVQILILSKTIAGDDFFHLDFFILIQKVISEFSVFVDLQVYPLFLKSELYSLFFGIKVDLFNLLRHLDDGFPICS